MSRTNSNLPYGTQHRRNCNPFGNVATVTMQTSFTVSVISFIDNAVRVKLSSSPLHPSYTCPCSYCLISCGCRLYRRRVASVTFRITLTILTCQTDNLYISSDTIFKAHCKFYFWVLIKINACLYKSVNSQLTIFLHLEISLNDPRWRYL